MLCQLLNIPSTQDEWNIWSYHHRLSHQAIRQAALARSVTLIDYEIDPVNREFITDWLDRNQQLHVDMDGLVGAQSVDLQDVDLQDRNQLVAWIRLHWIDHQTVETQLGIAS